MMRTRTGLVFFLALSLPLVAAACSGGAPPGGATDASVEPDAADVAPEGPPADAVPPDLSCVGNPLPTTAPDPIVVSGTTVDPLDSTGPNFIASVLVEAVARSGGAVADFMTSNALDGTFSLTIPTGGVPWDGFLRASEAAHLTTYVYPPDPLAMDMAGVDLPLINSTQRTLVYAFAGSNPAPVAADPAASTVIVSVTDCADSAVAAAVVFFSPAAARVLYFAAGSPSATATSTDATGVGIGLNVPADPLGLDVTAGADWYGTALATTVFGSWSNALVVTFVRP